MTLPPTFPPKPECPDIDECKKVSKVCGQVGDEEPKTYTSLCALDVFACNRDLVPKKLYNGECKPEGRCSRLVPYSVLVLCVGVRDVGVGVFGCVLLFVWGGGGLFGLVVYVVVLCVCVRLVVCVCVRARAFGCVLLLCLCVVVCVCVWLCVVCVCVCALRASLSDTFLQTLPELVTPLKGHSLSPRNCPPKRPAPSERFWY